MKGIFVIGTDTHVGKTFVSTLLLQGLRRRGIPPTVFKPFESGFEQDDPRADSSRLWQACGHSNPIAEWVCPYHFSKPLAPARAAGSEVVEMQKVDQCFEQAKKNGEFILVEGCGGLLVPLLPDSLHFTVENLVQRFNLPVLIVARAGLGTINHTLLTVFRCRQENFTVKGIVLNHTDNPLSNDPSLSDNAAVLKEMVPVPVWGPLAFQRHPEKTPNFSEVSPILDALL